MNQTAIDNVLFFAEYAFYMGCAFMVMFYSIETLEKSKIFKDYLTSDIE